MSVEGEGLSRRTFMKSSALGAAALASGCALESSEEGFLPPFRRQEYYDPDPRVKALKAQRGYQWSFDTDINAIELKVFEIVSNAAGVDMSELTRDTSFLSDLKFDSLDAVELVMDLEDEFDASIPDEEAEKIHTIGAAIDYAVNIVKNKNQ